MEQRARSPPRARAAAEQCTAPRLAQLSACRRYIADPVHAWLLLAAPTISRPTRSVHVRAPISMLYSAAATSFVGRPSIFKSLAFTATGAWTQAQ